MKTYLNCVPCFFTQAIESSKLAGANQTVQKKIINGVAKALIKFPLSKTPPAMGRDVFKLVRKITKNKDPYLSAKNNSNKFVLNIYGSLKKRLAHSKDRLLAAIELAIAGNIIDYGLRKSIDIKKEIGKILQEESRVIKFENKKLFNYSSFKKTLKKSKHILYIGDNAGEIVFDRLLMEEIKRMYPHKKISYAVRGNPIINDVVMRDAVQCGIGKIARVISSGMDAPGALLRICSKDFIKEFNSAQLIISKGQGNYEALSEEKGPVYFLFMAKCGVVAEHLKCKIRDILLIKNDKTK